MGGSLLTVGLILLQELGSETTVGRTPSGSMSHMSSMSTWSHATPVRRPINRALPASHRPTTHHSNVLVQTTAAAASSWEEGDAHDRGATHRTAAPPLQPDPSLYGWTPEAYPHPLIDPVRCAISGLLAEPEASHPTSLSSPRHDTTRSTGPPLYLCDPDWVLGGSRVLQDLSVRLRNASQDAVTGHPDDRPAVRHQSHVAIAAVRSMNLAAVLKSASYFTYQDDENDMVNDAAQIFARRLLDAWFVAGPHLSNQAYGAGRGISRDEAQEEDDDSDDDRPRRHAPKIIHSYILIFLSVQDRVCFITTSLELGAVLPWWRLDHVVAAMKPDLARADYAGAMAKGMDYIHILLRSGPPTWRDRLHDFVARFGVVMAFAMCTFLFGAWGEYRDRRRRWQYAEQRSKLSSVDRDKARQLQKDYHSVVCPICLELFDYGDNVYACDAEDQEGHMSDAPVGRDPSWKEDNPSTTTNNNNNTPVQGMKRVDTFGIPLKGVDGKRIKLLRCGHLFCETCWYQWVHSGFGNPCNCPVCRQDVGRAPRKRKIRNEAGAAGQSTPTAEAAAAPLTGQAQPVLSALSLHPTYGAVSHSRTSFGALGAALSSTPGALLETLRGNRSRDNALEETIPISEGSAGETDVTTEEEEGCCSHSALGGRLNL